MFNITMRYYDPRNILLDDSEPQSMAGSANFALARSFYHSRRYQEPHECNNSDHKRAFEYDRNAGAVLLYKQDGVSVYEFNKKEYHRISCGNKHFKEISTLEDGSKLSCYGHSARVLMRDLLDDLIAAEGPEVGIIAPSKCPRKALDLRVREFEILKYLTDNAEKYGEYLRCKGVIVKMWSERPACTRNTILQNGTEMAGGCCLEFMEKICPKGSQYGFIVKDYERSDNKIEGVPKVRNAFMAFVEAYEAYLQSQVLTYLQGNETVIRHIVV